MAYSAKIELVLINDRSAKEGNNDDKIVIRKNLDYNEFEITYTERSGLDTPVVYKTTGMYYEKVLNYVYMFLKNQYADDEPYHHVQVNIPAMPRVIMSSSKFKEVYFREHLYDLISTGLDLLETTVLVKDVVAPRATDNANLINSNLINSNYNHNNTNYNHNSTNYSQNNSNTNYYPNQPSARSSAAGAVPQHLYWD